MIGILISWKLKVTRVISPKHDVDMDKRVFIVSAKHNKQKHNL
jgi:hypothetical protein